MDDPFVGGEAGICFAEIAAHARSHRSHSRLCKTRGGQTIHRTVCCSALQIPMIRRQNNNHPDGWLLFWRRSRDLNPGDPSQILLPVQGSPFDLLGTSPNIMLAEREGFEPPVPCDITGFQDRRLKPLGHLSMLGQQANYTKLILPCQHQFYAASVYIAHSASSRANTILPAEVCSTLVTTAVTVSPISLLAPSMTIIVPSSK